MLSLIHSRVILIIVDVDLEVNHMAKKKSFSGLKVIPLGGVEEIGKT